MTYSQSSDGGLTWSANQRVSDQSSDADQLYDYESIDNMGYRHGMAFGPGYVLPGWVNSVPGVLEGNFFTDRGVFSVSTPTGTSTLTATSTSTSAPPTATSPQATGTPTTIASGTPTSMSTSTPIPTSCPIEFSDVQPGSTFYAFVRCLACQGVISGYACGGDPGEPCDPNNDPYFRPGANVTRGQAAKIISNSAGYGDPIPATQQTFNDVAPGNAFWLYVERVALHGAISGYECGGAPGEPCPGAYFRAFNNLTRGQLAKIDANVAGYGDPIPSDQQTFNDVPPTNPFWLYIERVYAHGVISGYECGGEGEPCPGAYFRPTNDVTRGQTAKIVSNTFFPGCSNPSSP